LPEDHKSWILENGLVLSKEKFQESLTEAHVADFVYKGCRSIIRGLHSAEFGRNYTIWDVLNLPEVFTENQLSETKFHLGRLYSTGL